MGRADFYKDGDYNAICDECGKKYKFSQLKKRWDGLYVCEREWEPRHPQDYLKGIRDNMSVPISRPDPSTSYIAPLGWAIFSTVSIGLLVNAYRTVIIGVSSLVSIVTNLYPVSAVNKTVNGFTLNKTTLG